MMAAMEAPGITRHRRPFLAPLWLTLLALVVVAGIAWSVYRDATTSVVVLTSSGEKEPGTIDDPPVSAEGRIDALYVSGERRAQQTVAPLAELLHVAPTVYDARDATNVAAGLLRGHEGTATLVIGGNAAVQQFLRQLGGSAAASGTVEPDLLYIVSVPTFGRPKVLRLKY
jgi:hypothetical protein